MATQTAQIWCSFCGKSHTAVDKMVGGPGVQICNECVAVAGSILEEHRGRRGELRLPMWESWTDRQMLDHIPRMAAVARQVETELQAWVRELRRRGVTWSRIGSAMGITRQSAWERFSGD
jgi:ClpX C4-type zinc finger